MVMVNRPLDPYDVRMSNHDFDFIYIRFLWMHDSENTARWEQAFSDDGGKTWETNWIMEKERVP
jgi:hypothetical protein